MRKLQGTKGAHTWTHIHLKNSNVNSVCKYTSALQRSGIKARRRCLHVHSLFITFAYSLICMKQCKKGTIKRREPHSELEGHIHIYVKTSKLFFITPQFQALEILARLSTGWCGQTDDHPRQWTLPESGCKRNLFVIHIGVKGYRRCVPRLQLYMYMFEYILFISPVSLLFFLLLFRLFPTIFFHITSLLAPFPLSFPLSSPLLFLLLSTRLQRCYTGQLNRVKKRALN